MKALGHFTMLVLVFLAVFVYSVIGFFVYTASFIVAVIFGALMLAAKFVEDGIRFMFGDHP